MAAPPRIVVLLIVAGLLGGAFGLAAVVRAQPRQSKVRPVPSVDLDRYMGRWYELARYPNRFQKRCTDNVVAFYSKRDDGRIDVRNTCGTAEGTIEAVGVARLADEEGPTSVLEVRFAPAFLSFIPAVWGDYWILDLSPAYTTAVVGSPDRDYLWILSRTPDVDAPTYARLIEAARLQGFDTERIVRTKQDVQ